MKEFSLPNSLQIFFLNNQSDTLIIQIYSVIKIYMFRASFLPIIRSSLLTFGTGKFRIGFDERFLAQTGWNWKFCAGWNWKFHPAQNSPVPNVQ
jgi:hypothetical protein